MEKSVYQPGFAFRPNKLGRIATIAMLIAFAPIISAQLLNVADDTVAPIPGVGHDYIHALYETVNPANGSVSLRIELPSLPGRGINFPFSITYDSGKVHHFTSPTTGNGGLIEDFSASAGGWGNNLPLLSNFIWQVVVPSKQPGSSPQGTCYYSTAYMFQDLSGTQHPLGLAVVSPPFNGPNGGKYFCQSEPQQLNSRLKPELFTTGSYDGVTASYPSGMCGDEGVGDVCAFALPPVTVTDLSGNTYLFKSYSNPLSLTTGETQYFWPDTIEDRNGNQISVASSASHGAIFTDTLKRTAVSENVPVSVSRSNVPTSYTVGGLEYDITYTTAAANYSVPTQQVTALPSVALPCVLGFTVSEGSGEGQQNPQSVVKSISLPNGQKYTFYYGTDNPNPAYNNPYGLLSEIDYPDGGWVRYTWKLSDSYAELATFDAALQNALPGSAGEANACNYQYKIPVVATRTVGYSVGSGAAQTQSFASYTTTWNSDNLTWSNKVTTVNTTDNVTEETAQTVYSYIDCSCSPLTTPDLPYRAAAQVAVEQSVTYYDWGSTTTPLSTSTKSWDGTVDLACEFDTFANQQTRGNFYSYTFGLLSDEKEYDYGQLSSSVCAGNNASAPAGTVPLRETATTFQQFTNGLGSTFAKPQSVVVNGSGTEISETDFVYDGGTVSPISATNHDETNFSSSVSANRGNPTTVTRLCLIGCPSPTTQFRTLYAYDETGQVTSIKDPNQNFTYYYYSDSPVGGNANGQSNAYLTKIVRPTTNSTAHIESYQYSYGNGLLVEADDENSNPTKYQYNIKPAGCSYQDSLNRLGEVDYPDGGKITYCYNDSPTSSTSPSVTTSELLGSSEGSKTSVSIMDGLGHVVQTQLTSDSSGIDKVDTTYNGMGQVQSVSNPYRSTSDSTYGITSYTYDALGRKLYQCQPDNTPLNAITCKPNNSYLQWSYTGNLTNFYDELRNSWWRTYDGLGRLTSVLEPDNAETDYTYDALDNLLTVSQRGVHRICSVMAKSCPQPTPVNRGFTYDALSRLLTSTNPETGTISYGYDANGNLSTKTDARNITTNYTYDALNRLLSKTYTNDTTGTASSCYLYDGASTANLIGRLTNQWTQKASAGACAATLPSSGYLTLRSILAYDSMGRVQSEQQCTKSNCATVTPTPYKQAYTYDLAGNILTHGNGVGTMTFINCYDAANHLLSVANGGTTCPATLSQSTTLFSTPNYNPAGGLTAATFGTGLNLSRTYDSRLRVTGETDIGNAAASTAGSATLTITGTEHVQ